MSVVFFVGGVLVDEPTPPFRFGLAHRAFQWQLLDVAKLSFRLVERRHLEQSLHLISNASSLGDRWFWHVAQQHCRWHYILAYSRETADGLLWLCVSDDLPVYISSSSMDTAARWVRQVLLEDLLEQDEALTILINFCLELS